MKEHGYDYNEVINYLKFEAWNFFQYVETGQVPPISSSEGLIMFSNDILNGEIHLDNGEILAVRYRKKLDRHPSFGSIIIFNDPSLIKNIDFYIHKTKFNGVRWNIDFNAVIFHWTFDQVKPDTWPIRPIDTINRSHEDDDGA